MCNVNVIYKEKNLKEEKIVTIDDLKRYFENTFSNDCSKVFDRFVEIYLSKVVTEKDISDYFSYYIYLLLQIVKNELENNDVPFSTYSCPINAFLNFDINFDKQGYCLTAKNRNPLYLAVLYSKYFDLENKARLFNLNYRFHNYFTVENERFYLNVDNIPWDSVHEEFSLESAINNSQDIMLKNYINNGQLSKVEGYRIIEKCINFKREQYRLGKIDDNDSISMFVAVFGTLKNKDILKSYLSKYQHIYLNITEFRNESKLDKMIFINDDIVYNLASRNDLKDILKKYDMVLFMDQPAFYSRLLSEKEKRVSTKIAGCKIFIDNYSNLKSIEEMDIFNKIDILKNIYKLVEDLNSLSDQMVCFNYNYDKYFVSNVMQALDDLKKTEYYSHVYFYISQIDATENIFNNKDVLFKKEIYNQRDLIVLRPETKNEQANVFNNLNDEYISDVFNDKKYTINLWKILKFDEYNLDTFFELYDNKEKMIDELVNSYAYLDFKNYQIDNEILLNGDITNISETSLRNYCKRMLCNMKKALHDNMSYVVKKFANSVFSEAKSLNYVMLYYFIDQINFSNIRLGSFDEIIKNKENGINNLNYVQKTSISNLLDILENTVYKENDTLRIANSIENIFKNNFSSNEENIEQLISYIDKWTDIYKIKSQINNNLKILKEGKCNYE